MTPKPSSTRSPTPSPTTTTPPDNDPPLPTFGPGGGNPYCFRDFNANGIYHKFGEDAGDSTIKRTCNNGDVLPVGNTFGFATVGDDNLLVAVTWARDQSGCPTKHDVPMRDWCTDTFRQIILQCDQAIEDDTYGGAFVESDADYGCVEWWIGTQQSTAKELKALAVKEPVNGTTIVSTPEQKQVVLDFLAGLQDEVPKMRRPTQHSNGTRLEFQWVTKAT
ncbi:hypothetical protein BDV96DRAFT_644271 [Lophiotrema nucula]|uniref:Uncharacterized protein n=1 Tax=Lophiotrema nucula TaxID=690887 RepID=A0A6A5ZFQ7_9PLEO|nr:hypothetical protein BDV96DRAFT_644271 [Lophiotrema nucula]